MTIFFPFFFDGQLLRRAVRGHHVHDPHPPADVVLFLQSDRTVRHLFIHVVARLHTAARFGRETHARYTAYHLLLT